MRYILTVFFLLTGFTMLAQRHNNINPTEEFKVTGAIKKEMTISINDLQKHRQEYIGDIVIRNHRGDPKDTIRGLKGILLKIMLDSVEMNAEKPKEYSEFYISLIASDGYKNVYSWNEIFNTEVGNHIYIVTEMDGKTIGQMQQRILVMSLADINTGRRHLIALAKVEFKKAE